MPAVTLKLVPLGLPLLSQVKVVELPRVSVQRSIHEVARAGYTLLTQNASFDQHDSLFVVSEGLGNLVAARSRVPTSCICLTPLKVVYDEFAKEVPSAKGVIDRAIALGK